MSHTRPALMIAMFYLVPSALACFGSAEAIAAGNVIVENKTEHDVTLIMKSWTPKGGKKAAKEVSWNVRAGVRSSLTVNDIPDFVASSVGYQIQNDFGVRTPLQAGKVWVTEADSDGTLVISITEEGVYKLPTDRNKLTKMMEESERTLPILQRAVNSARERKESVNVNVDPVLFLLGVASYQAALDQYERAEKIHAAIVKGLTSGNSSNPIRIE